MIADQLGTKCPWNFSFTDLAKLDFFSSPEPKAAGELINSIGMLRRPSSSVENFKQLLL